MADADKQIFDFKQQLAEKERILISLRAQLDEALAKNKDLNSRVEVAEEESTLVKAKYDESLELTLSLQGQIKELQEENK